jgi:type II secretory pathway component GspD/PulD (secretin)/tetratricopeptide (TPR) repeat protein
VPLDFFLRFLHNPRPIASMRNTCIAIVCLAIASLGYGQELSAPPFDPIQAAEEEALRRAETAMVMDLNLTQAERLQEAKDFTSAAKIYEQSIAMARKLGNLTAVGEQVDKATRGIVYSRLQMAYDLQDNNLFSDADAEVSKALAYDPENRKIAKFREFNREVEVAHRGRVPSPDIKDAATAFQDNRVKVLTLIRDGKAYFELRQLDEAEAKLKEAVKLDPQSDVAYYYLRLILETKYDLEGRARDHTFQERVIEVAEAWNRDTRRDLPQPNPYYITNSQIPYLTYTSDGAQRIRKKMNDIVIPEIAYDGLTLDEVVQDLIEQVKRNDPEKDGLNFLINSQISDAFTGGGVGGAGAGGLDDLGDLGDGGGGGAAPVLDAMGNPIAAPPPLAPGAGAPGVDLSQVLINIKLPLFNLRLEHVLDAITKTADQPIKYVIEEYAIVFMPKRPEQATLYTRIFKVNPDTFLQGLAGVTSQSLIVAQGGSSGGQGGGGGGGQGGGGGGGGQGGGGGGGGQGGGGGGQGGGGLFTIAGVSLGGGGQQGGGGGGGAAGGQGGGGAAGGGGLRGVTVQADPTDANTLVRNFFAAAGLGSLAQVFFNDKNGYLMVRATVGDLDVIQQAIELLNVTPPQVLVESKFAEIAQNDNKGYGFEWLLGNTPLNNGKVGLQAGTAPTYQDPNGSYANPLGFFPLAGGNVIPPRISDNDLTGTALRQSAPALFTITGILTDPQFRTVIHAIETRDGTDILQAPRVVTISGRQAQIRVTDFATIVTGISTGGQAGGGGGGAAGGGGGGAVNVTLTPITQSLPTGPILDVLPTVNADGFSINMTMIPSITEFVGFDDPGQFAVVAQSVAGNTVGVPLTVALPLPRTRVRQVATSVVCWDHQTVMLGGLISETLSSTRDKLPVLGDLPFFGKLFRSEHKTSRKSNLVIFVTPTIIDPAGNRVHTEEDLPYTTEATGGRRGGNLARRR